MGGSGRIKCKRVMQARNTQCRPAATAALPVCRPCPIWKFTSLPSCYYMETSRHKSYLLWQACKKSVNMGKTGEADMVLAFSCFLNQCMKGKTLGPELNRPTDNGRETQTHAQTHAHTDTQTHTHTTTTTTTTTITTNTTH